MKDSEAKARRLATNLGHALSLSRRRALLAWGLAAFLMLEAIGVPAAVAPSDAPKSVALLNVQFINDHNDLEPTTAKEQARLGLIGSLFRAKLESSGRYQVLPVPADVQAKIAAGPEVGACGGCEFAYGKELGADYAAWIVVQKVSDLILSINVNMADVPATKIAFVHSVDIRGNTDESWARGLTYLVRNYLLAGS